MAGKQMTEEEADTVWDKKKAKALAHIADREGLFPEKLHGALNEALYTFDQMGCFHDDVTVSQKQAIRVWAVVETIRQSGKWPEDLSM